MILNPAETEALVRAIDGLENYTGISLSRRDSLDNEHADGFLVVRVNWNDGGSSADVISEFGTTNVWDAYSRDFYSRSGL